MKLYGNDRERETIGSERLVPLSTEIQISRVHKKNLIKYIKV